MRRLLPILFAIGCNHDPGALPDGGAIDDMVAPAGDLRTLDLAPCSQSRDMADRPAPPFSIDSPIVLADGSLLLSAADLDGDAIADLLEFHYSSSLSLRHGRGDGTFADPIGIDVTGGIGSVAGAITGDFNRDGNLDIALCVNDLMLTKGRLIVVMGMGKGQFAPATFIALSEASGSLSSGDFDHDGNLDLVLLTNLQSSPSMMIYEGKGDGTFKPLGAVSLALATPIGFPVAGDWNGDGRADLAMAGLGRFANGKFEGAGAVILIGKGDGTFATPVLVPVPGAVGGIIAGDWNGDHKLDLAVSTTLDPGSSTGGVVMLTGRGDGTFDVLPAVETGKWPDALASADFNGDGHPDIAVENDGSVDLAILLGRGDGRFGDALRFATGDLAAPQFRGPQWAPLVTADFDRDGKWDVALAGALGPTVLRGNGDGTLAAGTSHPIGGYPEGMVSGDFDRDGHIDFATVLTDYPGGVAISFGTDSPNARRNVEMPVGKTPQAIALGDLDRDGQPDLIVGDRGDYDDHKRVWVGAGVNVLGGRGDGTFGAPIHFSSGASPVALAVADFNRDGNLDVATANDVDGSVTVLLGHGDGRFESATDFPIGARPMSIAVADLDGNGTVDIAVARLGGNDRGGRGNTDEGGVALLAGDGSGGFAPATDVATGRMDALAAGDVDGDGRADLVAVEPDFPRFVVLLGQCDGSLLAMQPQPIDEMKYRAVNTIALADLDGNGLPEAILGRPGSFYPDWVCFERCPSPGISILVNRGNGLFDPPSLVPAGYAPAAIVATDLDGDGRADLAIANRGGGTLSLLRNREP